MSLNRKSDKKSNEKENFSFVEAEHNGDSCRFAAQGHVSIKEAAVMEHKLERAIQAGYKKIVIDMSLVKTFTSAGIRVLLSTYKKLKSAGGKLQITNPSENIKNVIGMVALDELLLK